MGYLIKVKGINLNKHTVMNTSIYLLILFSLTILSCQNNTDKTFDLVQLNEANSITGLTGDSVKLVKTGNLHFKVKDIQQSSKAVSNLAKELGGMVFNQSLEHTETGKSELKISADSLMTVTVFKPQADITLRVPSQNLEEFMYRVTGLGYFTSSSKLQIDDQSLQYLENLLKQKNRSETLSKPGMQKDNSLTDLQAIKVKDETIDRQINNRTIDADAQYSTVTLSLFQNSLVKKEVIANYVVADYKLPFAQRIGNAMKSGWEYFLSFIIVIANLWMFIFIGCVAFLCYRFLQQKGKLSGLHAK
jgi:hypothetical protein